MGWGPSQSGWRSKSDSSIAAGQRLHIKVIWAVCWLVFLKESDGQKGLSQIEKRFREKSFGKICSNACMYTIYGWLLLNTGGLQFKEFPEVMMFFRRDSEESKTPTLSYIII